MGDRSSYLEYLPPVLWQSDPAPPAFSLGAMLRIFEKILTGIADAETLAHGDHQHAPIRDVIADIHRLFQPWQTPPEYLDWLASWVALRFPSIWDEVQRRKLTGEIVQVYQRRGLKDGIDQYLDLYTVSDKRPRVVVDDSSKILFARPQPSKYASVNTLVSQRPLVAPLSVARASDASLFVTDIGAKGANDEHLWRIFPPGNTSFSGAPPAPVPVGPSGWNLEFPVAVAVDAQSPYRVYVLDRRVLAPPATTVLFRLTAPNFPAASPVATKGELFGGTASHPVAMAFDPANGHLLILDRGAALSQPAAPRIVDVDVTVGPVAVTSTSLAQVIEPLSLAVLPSGALAVGDGREQNLATPGDVVLVDRSVGPWAETRLLALVPPGGNPLVAPTGLALDASGSLLVVDAGLKPILPDPGSLFVKHIARHAAIYRLALPPAAPAPERASELKQLVFPTGMVAGGDTVYLTDRGESADSAFAGPLDRTWRSLTQEFGVVVHFSSLVPMTPKERRRLVYDVFEIVNQEKPAHAVWTFVYSV